MPDRVFIGLFLCCICSQSATTSVSNASQLVSAIQSAASGDTILLNDGNYTLASTPLDIAKPLTIRSVNGPSKVTLTGPNSPYILIRVGASNTTLDGLTITGATGFGVFVNDFSNPGVGTLSNVILRNLVVSTTSGNSGQAISLSLVNNSVIELCTIPFSDFHSIAIGSSNWNVIVNNTIQQTRVGGGADGVLLENSDHNIISGNSISNTDFDGVQLQGSQYNYIALNTITSPHNGVTLSNGGTRKSLRNYVGNNTMALANKSGSDGLWFNNDSDWNMAFANDATGASENGMALFNAIGNYMRGNLFHLNPQGGLFIATISGTGTTTVPVNNAVQRNYFYNNQSNGGVTTAGVGATDVGFNFAAGDPAQITVQRGGFYILQGSSNLKIYGNTVQNLSQGEDIEATVTGTSLFMNRYLNANLHYTTSPAQVQWDSGSMVLGGNYFSNFSANGNPSTGATPFSGIFQDGAGHEGAYVDHYPYQSESFGKPYTVTVLTPPVGTSLAIGSQKTISWNSQGCVLVDVTLLNASNSASAIATSYADFGYYRWTVPAITPGAYSIQVSCKNSAGSPVGISATGPQFNITTGDLVLLSPQTDQIVDPGQSMLIAWKKSANVTQPVTVNIRSSDSGAYTVLQSGVSNDFVTVPAPGISSNKVSVQVVSGSYSDSTDGWLTIRDGNGEFTTPAGAASMAVGTPYPLEWVGPPGSDYVNIDLLTGSNTTNIATGLADFGKYVMLVPASLGSDSTLRLTFYNSSGAVVGTAQSSAPAATASLCDLNGDGVTNVTDVQIIINEALGLAPAVDDLNGDGVVNVADVQIVVNAALGLGCSAQ